MISDKPVRAQITLSQRNLTIAFILQILVEWGEASSVEILRVVAAKYHHKLVREDQ